jgi:hypothetical protein
MAGPKWADGVALLHVRYTFDNQLCENVFGYSYAVPGAPPTAAELTALGNEWLSGVLPSARQCYCPDVTFRELYMEDVGNPATNFRANASVSLGNALGTHSGNSGPGNAAVNVVLRSGYRGRHFRGAKRIGPIPANEQSRNEFTNVYNTLLVTYAAQWLLARVGGRFTPCIPSFTLHTYIRLNFVAFLDGEIDSQKTRLTGHGR